MNISHFIFLLVTYYLLFILYLFQTREMILDKKQIQAILLFKFKLGGKAVETTHNINKAFDPRTANIQGSGGSRSFAKETRALKVRSSVASHQKLATTIESHHWSWFFDWLHEKLLKNSMPAILWSVSIWDKLERWKNLISGFLMSWQNK